MDRKAIARETLEIMRQGYYDVDVDSVIYAVLDGSRGQKCIKAFRQVFTGERE